MATVVWIGGLMILTALVVPAARRALGDESAALLRCLRERFTPVSNLCIVILFVTGMFQMSADANYDGLLQISNAWSVAMLLKHVATVGMVVFALVLQYGVVPAAERTRFLIERGKGDPAEAARLRRREDALMWANMALAVVVLACTAYATAI
jgi:uncharacterized membrane protein